MELGPTSVAGRASPQERSGDFSSGNGGPLVSSFNTMNLPSCNKVLPKDLDKIEQELCVPSCSNGTNAFMDENLSQESTENRAFDASTLPADTLQKTCREHELGEEECNDPEAKEIMENFEPECIEANEDAARWIPAEKHASAAKVAQRVASSNVFASRRQTFFMIRMPRTADSQLRSKIKVAELQLEEVSKTRDVIRAALQLKRASKIGLLDKLKIVRDKERACKEVFQKKRLEIDPLQAALNKFKFADVKFKEEEIFSEEDLDHKIARLQHRIQHESIPLKEEKQLIREIKQLESQRSQVCANDAEHAHLLESYGPKEDIQEHLDILYRELDVLRAHQNQARLECEPIERDLEELNVKIDELVEQLEGAKRSQGAALSVCKELKKCLNGQNAEFYRNKDDIRKARELASSKNFDQLAALCHEQVESTLRCWNSDPGFREKYIKNNEHSTLRRLETLDGRSLGPDEEPLLLMSDIDLTFEILPKSNESGVRTALQKEAIAEAPLSATTAGNNVEKPLADEVRKGALGSNPKKEKPTESAKYEEKVAQKSESARPLSIATISAPVEDAAAAKEAQAAELKEKRRREEIAKAKEAAERKRKQAERAQAKAQLRALREAERREKEREKKAKKKATVGTEDAKSVEMPTIEESKRERVVEDLPAGFVKGTSSQGRGPWVQPLRSRRHPIVSSLSKKKTWQLPSLWLSASIVILVIGLALVLMAKL